MGNRVSLRHHATGLCLDCNGNRNGGKLVLAEPRASRDQWFILDRDGSVIQLRADHHPNRKVYVLDHDSVQLRHEWNATKFETFQLVEDGVQLVQFQCSLGYLGGSSTPGPAVMLSSGSDPMTLWEIVAKEEATKGSPLKSRSMSPMSPTGLPFIPSHTAFPRESNNVSTSSVHNNANVTLVKTKEQESAWHPGQLLRWVMHCLVWLFELITNRRLTPPEEEHDAIPSRDPSIDYPRTNTDAEFATPLSAPAPATFSGTMSNAPSGQRIELLRTVVVSKLAPNGAVRIHKPGEVERFVLQEGLVQEETIHFRVLQSPIVNLKRRMTTYKMSLPVHQQDEPMGSYEGVGKEFSFTFPKNPVPSGFFVRGKYTSTVEFLDDAGLCCPEGEKDFSIVKAS